MRRPDTDTARVISCHGSQAWVEMGDGVRRLCHLRGRSLTPLANDQVRLSVENDPPIIESIGPRRNTLLRQEGSREKRLAANIDLAWVVVSGHPMFSTEILQRVQASLASQRIPCWILLNKSDRIDDSRAAAGHLLEITPQRHAAASTGSASPVIATHVHPGGLDGLMGKIDDVFHDRQLTIALLGQSGMGKSSLLNRLIPSALAQTQAISEALQTGRHTTTSSQTYLWERGLIIDTPGFQKFGIGHLDREDLTALFPEWQDIQRQEGACRFADCSHRHEPGCQIRQHVSSLGLGHRLGQWEGLLRSLEAEQPSR